MTEPTHDREPSGVQILLWLGAWVAVAVLIGWLVAWLQIPGMN